MDAPQVAALVKDMDGLNMAVMVNLSGGSGEGFQKGLATLSAKHPKRFLQFANVDFGKISETNFGENAARQLEADVRNGASGLKVFKNLGMFVKNAEGKRVPTDDPRLDPIWAKCGELGIPVLIHVADPEAFFLPADRHNERLPGLSRRPAWYFGTPEFPAFDELMERQVRLFQRHPRTVFFGAHCLNRPDDLAWVGRVLERCPNVYAEISARIADLGRQPRTARAFFERYQDRVLFGTDGGDLRLFPHYFRVLETEDDLILPPGDGALRAGTAALYGLGLPDGVLRKLYGENAGAVLKLPAGRAAGG
jgi:predicted TIM-barrel fold metal-dependent hydrolase